MQAQQKGTSVIICNVIILHYGFWRLLVKNLERRIERLEQQVGTGEPDMRISSGGKSIEVNFAEYLRNLPPTLGPPSERPGYKPSSERKGDKPSGPIPVWVGVGEDVEEKKHEAQEQFAERAGTADKQEHGGRKDSALGRFCGAGVIGKSGQDPGIRRIGTTDCCAGE